MSANGIGGDSYKLRLLCDDDIICYGKNIDESFFSKQYFARFKRYKPLWKTEASFEHLTNGVFGGRLLGEISNSLQSLAGFGNTKDGVLIDNEFRDRLKNQLKQAETNGLKKSSYKRALDMCNVFTEFYKEQELTDFEFVILFTRRL